MSQLFPQRELSLGAPINTIPRDSNRWSILTPFNPREAMSTAQAAERAGKSAGAIRYWVLKYGIGRKIAGEMHISRVALEMLVEGDHAALARYHAGDRQSELVRRYFQIFGL
jgi:hypothetical protein